MSIWDRDKLITLTEWQRNFYYHIKYIIDAWVKLHYKIDNIISDNYKAGVLKLFCTLSKYFQDFCDPKMSQTTTNLRLLLIGQSWQTLATLKKNLATLKRVATPSLRTAAMRALTVFTQSTGEVTVALIAGRDNFRHRCGVFVHRSGLGRWSILLLELQNWFMRLLEL
jgi:hypothetical protein